MNIVGYTGEWSTDALARIVRFSATRCKYFVLIGVDNDSSNVAMLIDELGLYLHSRTLVTAWPGTIKLSGDLHEFLKFNATEASYNVLIERVLPELLMDTPRIEDLSLLRADGRPFFVTISHEHEAYFKIEQDDIHELETLLGAQNLIEEGEDQLPEEKY